MAKPGFREEGAQRQGAAAGRRADAGSGGGATAVTCAKWPRFELRRTGSDARGSGFAQRAARLARDSSGESESEFSEAGGESESASLCLS